MDVNAITRGRLKILLGAAALAVLVVASIVAVVVVGLMAAAPSSAVSAADSPSNASLQGASRRFSAFTHELPGRYQAERARLDASFAERRGALAVADFNMARPASVDGSSDHVWIAPAGDQVCIFIPDPVDGYGSSCSTEDDIDAGRAIAVLADPTGDASDAVVAAMVPDGATAPEATDSTGDSTTLAVDGNVAAARLPVSSSVRTAAGTIDLNFLRAGPARACAVGAGCSGK
ncbi:MAG: hypothetical protein HY827_04820 [Actinobacteria bacterium]|nr:hypothetical protein [Actinomycetota bacterium]